MKHLRLLVLLTPLMAGCYNVKFVNNGGGSPGSTQTIWVHTVVFGLISLNTVDVKEVCGDRGAYALRTNSNLWSMLLTSITAGIYSPVMAHVTCKS